MKKRLAASVLVFLGILTTAFGQEHTENSKDQTLRGAGRVNSSTLGMEFDLPLGNYGGRGINVPVSLSYSSKVWRIDNTGSYPVPATGGTNRCVSGNEARFAEHSAAGWTTSMQEVYVEYTGYDERFNGEGFPVTVGVECIPSGSASNSYGSFVRRLQLHLPSGESHELRMDEQPLVYDRSGLCGDPYAPCSNNPELPANWNGWYYAVDSSNLRYFEDRTNNLYFLQLPDGSKYTFNQSIETTSDFKTIRKSGIYTDRNGNQTTYHQANAQQPDFPNGYWTDTLGRLIGVPLPAAAPTAPGMQSYKLPGLSGQNPITYKFYWKKLKGTDAENSALSNFAQNLKYLTDWAGYPGAPNLPSQRAAGAVLFHSGWADWAVSPNELFNPVLLTAIELPNGQQYRFGYNEYGEIDSVRYPTGGKETFTIEKVAALGEASIGGIPNKDANRGVTNRKVYESENATTFYGWSYLAEHINTRTEFKTTITNPDLTKTERYLYKGKQNRSETNGSWGYSDGLAGMAYQEQSYNSLGQIISKKLTTWTKKSIYIMGTYVTADLHPRVTSEESIVYDTGGNGISTTSRYEYEGETTGILDQRDSPLLQKRTMQFGFVGAGSSLPATPERITETTFLQFDSNIAQPIKDLYKVQNMIGLATASFVKNGTGTIVSKSEMLYDESGYSPGYRGNPTTLRVWDSTKGNWDNPAAYVATRAKFDTYGNQYVSIDAKGNAATTVFDATYHAFPVRITTAIPDPTGQNGANTAFTTTATFDPLSGLPLTTTDANGLETRITYDPVTLRAKNTTTFYQNNQVGGMSEMIYHDEVNNSWVKSRSQIDTDKWAENISYFDGLGRAYKSEEINSQGNILIEKEFDQNARVKRITNPYRSGEVKQWTTNVYDEASRIKEVVLPEGATVKTNYGVSTSGLVGVTKQITDQAGKKRRIVTDSLEQLVRFDEPDATGNLGSVSSPVQPTNYVYNTLGKMTEVTQGVQKRHFLYDSLGRLLRIRQPEQQANSALNLAGGETSNTQWSVGFTYDNNDNVMTTTDANNITVSNTYDALNRIRARSYSHSITPTVNYSYDDPNVAYAKGRLTKVSSLTSETRYTAFDQTGKLLKSEQITDGRVYPLSYKYNLSGMMTEQTYPSGRIVKNFLEADGNLAAIVSKTSTAPFKNYASNFAYTASGVIKHLQIGNGLWESAKINSREQVTELNLGMSATDGSLWKLNYDYGELDANGNVDATKNSGNVARQKISFSGLANPFVQTYRYDSLDRITEAEEMNNGNQMWKQSWSYDRYGNRTGSSQTVHGQQSQMNAQTLPQIDSNTNRFQAGQGYTYDFDGNLIRDTTGRQFIFNGDNKQIEIRDAANNPVGRYYYDGNGKRVKKVTNTETVIFVYDGTGKLAAEYSTAAPVSNPTVNYTATDPLGSPRVITNKQGQIVSRRDFMPFGEEVISDATYRTTNLKYGSNDNVRQKFTGYQRDEESGLDFAEARYYHNAHGRFTAVDLLLASGKSANPQTFNRYVYTMNRPLILTDSTGLQSGQKVEKKIIPLPKVLLDLASLDKRITNENEVYTLSKDEIQQRTELATLAYNEGFQQGERNAQALLGENMDTISVESTNSTSNEKSNERSTESGISISPKDVGMSEKQMDKVGEKKTGNGAFKVGAEVNSGVAESVAGTKSVAELRQTVVNQEGAVVRPVIDKNNKPITVIVDTTKNIDDIIKHSRNMGDSDGFVSYLKSHQN